MRPSWQGGRIDALQEKLANRTSYRQAGLLPVQDPP
jgi:hypothetical protein